MKIDLDLEEIFDEEGRVEDSIKERIILSITNRIYTKIERDIKRQVDELINTGIKEKLNSYLAELIPSLMDYEFQETSPYGEKKEPITVKNKILRVLQTECQYKESRSGYSGDQNAFTKAMENIIERQMKLFKPEFDKEINAMFIKEAMAFAKKSLQEKLGIK
jgi:hypothetical protein